MRERFRETYLPQCLAIGISEGEFWEMNITKLRPYLLADELKWKQVNRQAHLYGRYVFDAVSTALANALRGKHDMPINYLDEPYDFDKLAREHEQEVQQQKKIEAMKARFSSFAIATNKKLEEK